jgi:hypothetical protein
MFIVFRHQVVRYLEPINVELIQYLMVKQEIIILLQSLLKEESGFLLNKVEV